MLCVYQDACLCPQHAMRMLVLGSKSAGNLSSVSRSYIKEVSLLSPPTPYGEACAHPVSCGAESPHTVRCFKDPSWPRLGASRVHCPGSLSAHLTCRQPQPRADTWLATGAAPGAPGTPGPWSCTQAL